MKADRGEMPTGKNEPVVLQIDGDESATEETEVSSETLAPYLQQIDYSINQQTQVISILLGVGLGLMVGLIFSVWLSKLWK